jgi:hypothetical protein
MCPNGMVPSSTSSDIVSPTSGQNHDQDFDQSTDLVKVPPSATVNQSAKINYSETDSSEANILRDIIASAR